MRIRKIHPLILVSFLVLFLPFLSLANGEERDSRVWIGEEFVVKEGEVFGDVVAIGSSGSINGQVQNLVAIGSNIEVGPNALVLKDLVVIGSRSSVDASARVMGERVNIFWPRSWMNWSDQHHENMHDSRYDRVWRDREDESFLSKFLYAHVSWLLSFALGALLIYLFPVFYIKTVAQIENAFPASMGFGFIGLLFIVPIAILLVISIVGILLIPIYIVSIGALFFVGHLLGAAAVARFIPALRDKNQYWVIAVGLYILKIVGLIPFFGWTVLALTTLVGFGSALKELFDRFPKRRAASL